jgi:hypothetical protein
MTPFSAWAMKREGCVQPDAHDEFRTSSAEDLDTEFQGLLDALIDNLSSASAAQLSQTLCEMNASWCEREAQKITTDMQSRIGSMEERIMASLTEAMRPVMSDIYLKRTMQEFTETLRKLLPEFNSATVAIKAPAGVQGVLAETLAEQHIAVELLDTDKNSISATSKSVMVSAELEDWMVPRLHASAS